MAAARSAGSEYPVFEQVADAAARGREQVEGVRGLDVVRQDEHAHRLAELHTQLPRSAQSLDGVGGGHADVDDHHVGAGPSSCLHECVGVTDLGHHLEPLQPEQLGEPGAQQRAVLRQH